MVRMITVKRKLKSGKVISYKRIDLGTIGKNKVKTPKLKIGALNISYNPKIMKMYVRRAILKKKVRKDGYATIIRRLNLIKEFNKKTNKKLSQKALRDMRFLRKFFKK